MNIDLSIDSIVIHGQAGDRDAIGAAVERELGRLLAERGLPPGIAGDGGSISASPPPVRVPHGLRPDAIGARVAAAIYANIAGGVPGDQR
jgi:hypothetical protein